MLNPRELRDRRLENEYKELMRLNGDLIKVEPLGKEPYDKYQITFNIRTIISPKPTYSNKTVCSLTLPPNYPDGPPRIMPKTPPPLNRTWHDGYWCVGAWHREESLVSCIIRCARTLQCDPDISGYSSDSQYHGKNLWEEAKLHKEMVLNNKQILSALSSLDSIVIHSQTKPRIEIKSKSEKPKITILSKGDV